MTRKDGGTAFPMQDPQAIHAYAQAATEAENHERVEDRDQTYIAARAEAVGGMSLRDYLAAKAMQAMLTRDCQVCTSGMAKDAYIYADAMLAARSA